MIINLDFKRSLLYLLILCLLLPALCQAMSGVKVKKPASTGETIFFVPVQEKLVALTFDDGPNEPATGTILDTLKRYNVRATFFLVGTNAEYYPATARRIAAEGHVIGNHTYRHSRFDLSDQADIAKDITAGARAISATAGVKTRWFRPPFGINGKGLDKLCTENGYAIAGWSLDANDWNPHPTSDIVKHIVSHVTSGDIILLHDGRESQHGVNRQTTVEAVPLIIERLQKAGYKFVTLPELYRNKTRALAEFANGVRLLGMHAPDRPVSPGETIMVRYFWQVPSNWDKNATMACVHLLAEGIPFRFQDDHKIPPRGDARDLVVRQKLTVPTNTPPGSYFFNIGLFDPKNPGIRHRINVRSAYPQRDKQVTLPAKLEVKPVDREGK